MVKDKFIDRHNGPRDHEIEKMLKTIGVNSVDEFIDQTIPASIRLQHPLNLPEGMSEYEFNKHIRKIGSKNKIFKSFIGLGYYNTITPAVILRNILENPSWYTSYTPYQAEISQGRLEALLNFQTMVSDLTAMEIANASLLDEATAAAEAMIMLYNSRSRAEVKSGKNVFFVDENIFLQTIDVLRTRAMPLGIELRTGKFNEYTFNDAVFGSIVQYPAADGIVNDYQDYVRAANDNGCRVAVIADLMSLTLLTPPGEWGADVVVGTTQRFGIPLGFGGPHAAYFATKEKYKRNIPGRIIGVSKDKEGRPALRMALQVREQHIKRERATSNICTAQALLAIMAGMYGVYHGAEGLKRIATNIHQATLVLSEGLKKMGYKVVEKNFFDTLTLHLPKGVKSDVIRKVALHKKMNFLYIDRQTLGISLDETTSLKDVNRILKIFAYVSDTKSANIDKLPSRIAVDEKLVRKSDFMTQKVFNVYHSETELMRYIKRLERKDFSLTHSMISLGSCTMKLNAAVQLFPLSWPEFGSIHPFVPYEQVKGYHKLFEELEENLKEITGFGAFSFQPNSGAAGEYAGLMVIREYQKKKGEEHRNIVLIPSSAHGTNPASAVMAGMKVIVVKCDANGNIDVADLRQNAEKYKDNLSSFMVTYPSTHGVFEEGIIEMCEIIHQNGGQVYMDGANMNAQVGLTNPALIGADVCHLNLHKTFAIPHGGGGPGVGPIGVANHLKQYLPAHSSVATGGKDGMSAVAAAPFGSASIYAISYGYVKMLGANGLLEATKMAILNANYIASSLKDHYDILYTGKNDKVAHEMILECRNFKNADIDVGHIAKRLIDYGFHAPTVSFPVHGTLMVEPTESESLQELDRFILAMINIRKEIDEIANNEADKVDNVLRNAPHTANVITANEWDHSYSRQKAAFPLPWIAENKFFPAVSRLDDAYGDRNLSCSCAPLEDYL